MACTSDKLLDNIKWRMESLRTHTNTDRTYKDFIHYDKEKLTGELSPGMTRGFFISVLSGDAEEPKDGLWTEAVQASMLTVLVSIAYYKQGDWHSLQKLMQQDAFDVKKLLRNPSNWDGTEADGSAAIGADARMPVKWVFRETAHAVYLEMTWQVYILEDE